ncbi:hypothetical protein V8C34DRAFT_97673 [Trichoderma compactum]
MRDTAARRQAIASSFAFYFFNLFPLLFSCFSDRRKATPNETLSTFLGSLGRLDWPRNTRHGMAIRLPHLAHSDLHLSFPFPFLLFFFSCLGSGFIFFWADYIGLWDLLFVKEGPRHAPGVAYVVTR